MSFARSVITRKVCQDTGNQCGNGILRRQACHNASLSVPEVSSLTHSAWAAGTEDAAYSLIQHRAPALLRKVSSDNFAHLAELFTAAVLQAAATGEVVLDEELGNLAKQDVSKFQRITQRLQVHLRPSQAKLTGKYLELEATQLQRAIAKGDAVF
jgi:hypothetical protein